MKPLLSLIAAACIALPLPSYAQAPETPPAATATVAKPTPAPRVVKPRADPISTKAAAVLVAPATYKPGVVAFSADQSIGNDFSWKIDPPELSHIIGDGRKVFWVAIQEGETRPFVVQLIVKQIDGGKIVDVDTAVGIVVADSTIVVPPVVVPPVVPPTPDVPPVVVPTDKPTAAVYIYEKDDGSIPPPVGAALDKINREKKVTATSFEDDSLDGDGDVPEQYKLPLAAAREIGLPAFIVMAGDKVINRVKAPTTLEQVMGAVP